MQRRLLNILLLCTLYSVLCTPVRAIDVTCGTWLQLRAVPVEDWHFERWSDGNTDSVRLIEITSDTTLYAHFAPNCGDYAALPVVSLYDWLLMLDVRTIQAKGYYFTEDNVTWYRVRGVADKIGEGASANDERMGTGYSLTIDKSFKGTGDYYAVVDASGSPSGVLCTDLMRSELVHYASSESPSDAPLIEPTMVRPREQQRLLRLNPTNPTTVTIYDITGHRLQTLTADGVERMSLQAESVAGCYQVVVQNGEQKTVLRYIVTN